VSGAWLVLPTYNEVENIDPFVRAVLPKLASASPDHHLLIVDDNSPDGTGAVADKLAAEFDAVEVFHRPAKQGLGRAYLAGFRRVLDSGADLVMQMDADFSHDPADVPRLIEAAAGVDLAVGSRYTRGGGVSDWGLFRRMLSRGGCWYAQHILGVRVKDLTGGFKCWNRRVLESLELDNMQADGYGFQIEMTYYAIRSGFSVVEVPITFRERQVGTSKMSPRIALEAVWKVPALRMRRDR
jgi:dolichol-phosphate mannosyltransferase